MSLPYSLVAITPAGFKTTAEALGLAMGHSGQEFSVPLPNSTNPTHYGLHAWVSEEVAQIWLGNAYPDTEFTNEQVDAVRSNLIISCLEGVTPVEHWQTVLLNNNITQTEE